MLTRLVMAAVLCGAAGVTAAPAHAAPVNATAPIALFNVMPVDGSDLSNATAVRFASGVTTSRGAGDFGMIPAGTAVSVSGPLHFFTALGGLGSDAFSFTIASYGTFVTTDAPRIVSSSVTSTSTGVEAYLLGLFTPAAALGDFTPGPASFDVSFTRSSATNDANNREVSSTSGSGTLASPPAAVPVREPGSLLLLAPALMGLAIRKRAA